MVEDQASVIENAAGTADRYGRCVQLPTWSVPAETIVPPVYVLLAVSIRMPVPPCVKFPEPLMVPPKVWCAGES